MRAERGLRRIRGAMSLALLWSIAWLALGAVLGIALPLEGDAATLRLTIASMQLWGVWGAIAGLVYAVCLTLEPVGSFQQVSNRRGLFWGTLSGLVVPFGLSFGTAAVAPQPISASFIALSLGFGVAGAFCGLGTLALARHADSGDSPTTLGPPTRRLIVAVRLSMVGLSRRIRDAARPKGGTSISSLSR